MAIAHVKNWSEFQHYKNRCPPWIKLRKSILDDFEFSCLPIASKAIAPLLWLLASESMDGAVRIDADWLAFRLRFSIADVNAGLSPLIEKGFLILASGALAPCLRDACLEGEGEGEAEISNPNGLEVIAGANDVPAEPDDGQASAKSDKAPIQAIVAMYHAKLPACRRCEKITKARAGYIRQRWREDLKTLEQWGNYLDYVAQSPFLMGKTQGRNDQPPFVADIEFLTKQASFVKIAEGKYHQ
jgi:hypothetical protein